MSNKIKTDMLLPVALLMSLLVIILISHMRYTVTQHTSVPPDKSASPIGVVEGDTIIYHPRITRSRKLELVIDSIKRKP